MVHGKTGILVDPTSVEDTAQAIIALLENPSAASQMGREGRKWAQQYFTEDALRRSLGELQRELRACAVRAATDETFSRGEKVAEVRSRMRDPSPGGTWPPPSPPSEG